MSKDDEYNPLEKLQEQLRKALQQANINVNSGLDESSQNHTENGSEADSPSELPDAMQHILQFNHKPREIRDYLNRFVIRQDEAKRVLAVAICDHYNHVRRCLEKPELQQGEYHKQNVLLLGPTGVGKTYLMRHIARLIGVPFVKADATKFSETGYVGSDVEDLVRDLVKVADGNVDLAEYGIIYIDEIDKIASSRGQGGKDVSGRGVQINLLKLMEEAEVNLFSPTDMMGQMQAMMEMQRGGRPRRRSINTRHILFIVSGAFDQLAEEVQKRVDAAPIGFGANHAAKSGDASDYLHHANTRDFIKYGFEPEFIGRLPVRVACETLKASDLADILLSSEGSLLKQYKNDFAGYGIDFQITSEAIHAIAARAHEEMTGARGLMTVFESVFRHFKFELPSSGIQSFEVTAETVEDPQTALRDLLKENKHLQQAVFRKEIETFGERFAAEHGLTLEFTDAACDRIIEQAVDADETIRATCERSFRDFQHGLSIVSRNTGQTRFTVDDIMVANPDKVLSQMVVESFKEAEQSNPAPKFD